MKMPVLPDIPGVSRNMLKTLSLFIFSLLLFAIASLIWSGLSGLDSSARLQQRRFDDLVRVVKNYNAMPDKEKKEPLSEDPIVIVSSIIDSMGLKSNLVQVSALSKGLSVQLARLYSGKALAFLQEISKRGLFVDSAELRAVSENGNRLLSLTLIVTVAR